MSKGTNEKKTFRRRRCFIVAVISLVCLLGGWVAWRTPRRTWSLQDASPGTAIPQISEKAKHIRNVVLISVDTLRADHLSCYGYSRTTSPNIDALASESIVFNHAVSPVPITLPAHSTMLTGTTPLYHNVHDNIGYKLAPANVTLAEILKDNGFATGAIIGAFPLMAKFGLNQGFDSYDDNIITMPGAPKERQAEEVSTLANAWLKKHHQEKFFLFLHYYDPHGLYQRHKDFRFGWRLPFSSESDVDLYDGEIAYTDHHIGRVIDNLKQMGLYDSTLILLTGDHGESLTEHNEGSHGFFIYHSSMHVPLMIKLPGATAGVKIHDVAGLVDIVPTVCGLLGIDPPEQVEGQNLLAAQADRQDRAIYCESLMGTKYGAQSLRALVTSRYKYIETTNPELYDLSQDPRETKDLSATQPQLAKTMQARLLHRLGPSIASTADSKMVMDSRTMEQLASLGYVGGTVDESIDATTGADDPKEVIYYHQLWEKLHLAMFNREYAKAKELLREIMAERPNTYFADMTVLARAFTRNKGPEAHDPTFAIELAEFGAAVTQERDPANLKALTLAYRAAGHERLAQQTAIKGLKLQAELKQAAHDQPAKAPQKKAKQDKIPASP